MKTYKLINIFEPVTNINFMKKLIFFLLPLLLFSCNHSNQPTSIDLTSVDYFFNLADKISNKETISETEWDSLFSTPGYAILTERITSKEELQEVMLIAFHPERRAQRDTLFSIPTEKLMDNPILFTSILMLGNFTDMQNHWDELKQFRKDFDFSTMENQAIAQLRSFLVNPVDSLIELPSINMLCMDPKARSLSKGIIMDFNIVYKSPKEMTGILAHEMFHSYRSNFIDDDFIYTNSVVAAMELLMNEGLTDQVDKDDPMQLLETVGVPELVKTQYKYAYDNTPQILKELDSLAVSYIDGNMEQRVFWNKAYDHIAFEGHPNGYYMTSMIKRQGLMKELMDNFVNPVAFARIYNKAAAREGSYTFSEKLMTYLEKFEANYRSTEKSDK